VHLFEFPNVIRHQYRAQAQRVRCNNQVIVANQSALLLCLRTDTAIVPADILTQCFKRVNAPSCSLRWRFSEGLPFSTPKHNSA
jgi:hypothetical protein